MNHVAIDVHDEYSQICVMNQAREVLAEAKVPTTRAALNDFFRHRASARVVLEAGPHAHWISEVLVELGHETIVCHARRIRLIAESRNKNDRVDAETLVRLSLSDLELIKPIELRSAKTLDERTIVRTRAAMIDTQKRLRTMLRGIVKPFGLRLPAGKKRALTAAATATLPAHAKAAVDSLLAMLVAVATEIRTLDEKIESIVDAHPATRRLQSVPGIGPLVAIAFVHTIEDPARFGANDVGPFLGLTPSNRSSAGKKLTAKQSGRPGDPYVRSLLVQSAWTLMNSRSESDIARWGRRLAEKVGGKKAAIAVARKLATLMHHLWLHDEDFRPHPRQHALPATA